MHSNSRTRALKRRENSIKNRITRSKSAERDIDSEIDDLISEFRFDQYPNPYPPHVPSQNRKSCCIGKCIIL